MRHWGAAIALALLAVTGAAAAGVDPAVVGNWERTFATPQGPVKSTWEIHADGTYRMRIEGKGAMPSHDGAIDFDGGYWTMKASKPGLFGDGDKGVYRLDGANTLIATGYFGPVTWQRAGTVAAAKPQVASAPPPPPPPPKPVEVRRDKVGSQAVPSNVAELTARAREQAKNWQADAVLISLDVLTSDPKGESFDLAFQFFAPESGTGGAVAAGGMPDKRLEQYGKTKLPLGMVPPQFAEVKQALTAARAHGLETLKHAQLRAQIVYAGHRVLVWEMQGLAANGAAVTMYVDGFTGNVLDGTPQDYARNSEALDPARTRLRGLPSSDSGKPMPDWDNVAQRYLQFARSRLPRPDAAPANLPVQGVFDTPCVLRPACAASVADPAARDRIDAGFPTAADIAKWDK